MLADVQPDRIFFWQLEIFRASSPALRDIRRRLEIDAVFDDIIGTFVAVFAKRERDRFLGHPYMIHTVKKVYNALHLFIDDGLESNRAHEVIPVF